MKLIVYKIVYKMLILKDLLLKVFQKTQYVLIVNLLLYYFLLTLTLLTWTIWRAPTNASKWRMGFNSAFKRLKLTFYILLKAQYDY